MQSEKTGYRSRIEVAFSVVKRVFRVIRHGNEARQHGKGDGDEGLDLQRVHQGDDVVPRRCPSVAMLVRDLCKVAVSIILP